MKTVTRFLTWAGLLGRPLSLGQRGEKAAARYLRRQGYRVLARNVRSKFGELDLVALDGRTIVFVEVKTRVHHEAGLPAEAIDSDKQRRLTRLALHYLRRHRLLEQSTRFDVVAVTWPQSSRPPSIKHYRNAFPASGRGQMFS